MKSILSVFLTGGILLITTTGLLKAQENTIAFNDKKINPYPGSISQNSSIEKLSEMEVNIKAVRDFVKQFKQTDNVHWYKISDGYIASFFQNGDKVKTAYDFKGNWLYNLVAYSENKLPRDVWHLVKSTYYDFNITWVDEIKKGNKKIYIVHLKNKYFFQNVKVCDGELEIIEQLKIKPLNE